MKRWRFVIDVTVDEGALIGFNDQQEADGEPTLPDSPKHWSLIDLGWADDADLLHEAEVVEVTAQEIERAAGVDALADVPRPIP